MQNNPIEFLKEAAIMHSIDHAHIVRLYGVVLDTDSLMLVSESFNCLITIVTNSLLFVKQDNNLFYLYNIQIYH